MFSENFFNCSKFSLFLSRFLVASFSAYPNKTCNAQLVLFLCISNRFSKSIFCSPSCVALYANNKTPEPIGHFILTINPTNLFFRRVFLFPLQLSSLPALYSYLISCSMTIPDWNWIISFSAKLP